MTVTPRRLAPLLATIALLLLALPVAAEPTDGVVSGQVVNKSAGGSSTAGTSVVLIVFGRKEQKPVGQQTTQADADGRYTFSGLDRDPNIVYIPLVRFQNVNYPADQPFQLQDQPNHQADIAVYESTTTDDTIQFEALNLLVLGADQGVLQFMEMGALVNGGDRTFVTANPQDQQLARAIKLPLPNGALSVQMQTGFNDQDVIPGVGGIQITSPVPPGRHEFALSFQLPYSGSSADISLQVPYPTTAYSVFVPDNGLKLQADTVQSVGPSQFGGQTYALYRASSVAKATMLSGQLTGLGATAGLGPTQLALISLGVVLFVLGGGVLLFTSQRSRGGAAAVAEEHPVDMEQERLELVVRLAALDERFAAGDVEQTEYELERQRGKQRLRELALVRRQISPSST